ncbi:hypothetical protein GPALN_005752 [Globodera pallida]|nr:hypothetical protein GPALN_005752 [Globodera pallida]
MWITAFLSFPLLFIFIAPAGAVVDVSLSMSQMSLFLIKMDNFLASKCELNKYAFMGHEKEKEWKTETKKLINELKVVELGSYFGQPNVSEIPMKIELEWKFKKAEEMIKEILNKEYIKGKTSWFDIHQHFSVQNAWNEPEEDILAWKLEIKLEILKLAQIIKIIGQFINKNCVKAASSNSKASTKWHCAFNVKSLTQILDDEGKLSVLKGLLQFGRLFVENFGIFVTEMRKPTDEARKIEWKNILIRVTLNEHKLDEMKMLHKLAIDAGLIERMG